MGLIRLKIQPRKSKEDAKNSVRFKVRLSLLGNEIKDEKGLTRVKDKTKEIEWLESVRELNGAKKVEENCTEKALQRFSDEYLKECRKLSPTEIAQWLEDFRLLYGEYLGPKTEPNQLQNFSKNEE